MEELARESISLLASASAKSPLDPGPRLGSAGSVFIMLKSALGAGLLNFPWAFERAGGVRSAVTVELISLVFLISGLIVLAYSSSISGQSTYQAVVKKVCGPAIGQLCEICFIFNLFMISVAFLVIVNDQLEKLRDSMYELATGLPTSDTQHHFYTDQRFLLLLLCFFVILPLSVSKEISIQKYSSVLGTLAATYLTVAVIIKYHSRPAAAVHNTPPLHSSSSWASMFSVIPTICFGFQCHEASVILDPLLKRRQKHGSVREAKFESRSRYVLTAVWIMVTLLIAVFVPDISKVISVIGGISACFIFIFPGLCLMFAMQSEPVSCKTRVALTVWGVVTLICGAFVFGHSTTLSVLQLLGKI
uniref:Solute carrier family 38, member 8 n=1 Tax=Nothobranchius pienaari TaxID=704102 RepID=A0A1A8MGD5_9TELE